MLVRVDYGGWEHECCGDAAALGDRVRWDVFLPMTGDVANGAELMESHHGGLANGVHLVGTVAHIAAVGSTGTRHAVARIPSGRAVRGFDPDDDGRLDILEDGSRRRSRTNEFVVTLDVPDEAALPTLRATSMPD
jgi:hypothetical protein